MATSRQRGASTTSTGVLGVVAVVALSAATAAGLYIYRKRRAEAANSFATSAGGAPDAAAAALAKGGVPVDKIAEGFPFLGVLLKKETDLEIIRQGGRFRYN